MVSDNLLKLGIVVKGFFFYCYLFISSSAAECDIFGVRQAGPRRAETAVHLGGTFTHTSISLVDRQMKIKETFSRDSRCKNCLIEERNQSRSTVR